MWRPGRDVATAVCLIVCALVSAPATAAPGDTCAEAIEVAALPFSNTATTCAAGNDFSNDSGAAAVCPDLPGPYGGEDVFYKLTLAQGNRVAFELNMPAGATGDLALFLVRKATCADPGVCAGNSVDLIGAGVGPERIKAPAQSYPSGTYFLIVDSAQSAPSVDQCGGYTLNVTGHLSEFCGNGIVETGEVCDDGNNLGNDCCAADCTSKAVAGTPCRGAAGSCDLPEACSAAGVCPPDQLATAGTVCRPGPGSCDLAEVCTGSDPLCPVDRFAVGVVCRPSAGPCDQAELCSGSSAACPPDQFRPAGDVCAPTTHCTLAARCGGSALCGVPPPRNCDDGDPCTRDECNTSAGCVHVPVCADAGMDAGSDANRDAGDASSDGLMSVADAPVVVDPVQPDTGVSDTGAATLPDTRSMDLSPSPPDGVVPDTASTILGMDAAPSIDASSDAVVPTGDASDIGAMSDASSAVSDGSAASADAGLTTDASDARSDAQAPPGSVRNVSGGCGCRVAGSYPGESALWSLFGLAVVVRFVRRRQRRP